MTITTTNVQVSYLGNGVTTVFPTTFEFQTNSGQVFIDVDGVRLSAGFAVVGAGDPGGGSVIFDVAPALAADIFISRRLPLVQEIDPINNSTIFGNVLSRGLDTVTMIVQQIGQDVEDGIALIGPALTAAQAATAAANAAVALVVNKADNDLGNVVNVPPIVGTAVTLFRLGNSKTPYDFLPEDSFIEAVDIAAGISTVGVLNSYGSFSGGGNDFTTNTTGIVPPGPSATLPYGIILPPNTVPNIAPGDPGYITPPPYDPAFPNDDGPLTPGRPDARYKQPGDPGYSGKYAVLTGGWQQNTLKVSLMATGTQMRPSYYRTDRGDGFPGLQFNDLALTQATGQLRTGIGSFGRLFGIQVNPTIPPGPNGTTLYDGQLISGEYEIFNGGLNIIDYFAANQKIGIQIAAIGDGYSNHGLATKGLTFGARDGGAYQAMIYSDPSFTKESFFRLEGSWTMKNILNQVVMAWGTMSPRAASDMFQQVVKPSQVYQLLQIADITPEGQIFTIYQSIDPTEQYSVSHGLHTDSGEYRFAQGEGLNIGAGFPGSRLTMALSEDRIGLFGSPAVAGGSNHLFLANGTNAASASGGSALTSVGGVLRAFQPGIGADSLLRFTGTATAGAVTPANYITVRLDTGAQARIPVQLI